MLAVTLWFFAAGGTGDEVLAKARALQSEAPVGRSTTGGEYEGHEWWERHAETLSRAWDALPALHPRLVRPNSTEEFESAFVGEGVRRAVRAARRGDGEGLLRDLMEETEAPGVYAVRGLLTPQFLQMFRDELAHRREAGIPIRRPNGMNRYGSIVDDVGLGQSIKILADKYLAPIGQMLYPRFVTAADTVEQYSFTIRYSQGGDRELASHTDASAVTFNICLGGDFESGGVFFDGIKFGPESAKVQRRVVEMEPGTVIVHRGAHEHGAMPLKGRDRENLVVWLTARWGVVRVAEYSDEERGTEEERWGLRSARIGEL
eukprot:Hpha_TRINITY_DN23549_c0_g1::TRINITY_DN23549_c0_g1_i1::g.186517::m.186517